MCLPKVQLGRRSVLTCRTTTNVIVITTGCSNASALKRHTLIKAFSSSCGIGGNAAGAVSVTRLKTSARFGVIESIRGNIRRMPVGGHAPVLAEIPSPIHEGVQSGAKPGRQGKFVSGPALLIFFLGSWILGRGAEPLAPDSQQAKNLCSSVTASASIMAPVIVSAPEYRAYLSSDELRLLNLLPKLRLYFEFGPLGSFGSFGNYGAYVATPLRIPQRQSESAFCVDGLSGSTVRQSPAATMTGTLGLEPEFLDLGRLEGSRFSWDGRGCPMYGAGAWGSGAKVVLDDIHFSDPFTGRIPWEEVPMEGVSRIEAVAGGGATAWGDGATGGVVQIFTTPAIGELARRPGTAVGGGPQDPTLTKEVVVGTGQLATTVGSFGTLNSEFVAAEPTGAGVLQVLGDVFTTGGFTPVERAQRGAIDKAAWDRHG